MRAQRSIRGTHTLTLVDPGLRIRKRLAVQNIAAEMNVYSILDRYCRGNQSYADHYVCLWEVIPEEIVGHWDWNGLATNYCGPYTSGEPPPPPPPVRKI